MIDFALINLADDSVVRRVDGAREFLDGSPPDISHKGLEWRPIVQIGEDDPVGVDEIKEGPVEAVTLTEVTRTWIVRPMTAQEITDRDQNQDRNAIRDDWLAGAEIEISLIDALLAKGVIAATDFPAATRQKYEDLKARVDRVR